MPPDDTIIPGAPGDPRAHFPDDAPGTQVGPYKLVSQLGEGGFGAVWLAERREPFVQRVALKIVKAGMDSKAVVARFEQERQALAVMNHPGIAKVFDGGLTSRGRPYFAMEYVKGEPITDFCDRVKLGIEDRLRLFEQACEAVQHAHLKGIVHRDLKPSNILAFMVEGEGPKLKVIDFGVAKAMSQRMSEHTIFTETGQMIGTPEYMSPEQADPTAGDIDTRSDIYSLGVLLYELLVGATPFDGKELRKKAYGEIQRTLREQDPPSPSARLSTLGTKDRDAASRIEAARKLRTDDIVRRLRGELEWIPLKAMRKEPQHRYQTAIALAEDVRNYLEGKPLVAAPESTAYRVRKYVRRNRALVVGAGAVLGTLVLGIGLATWQWTEAAGARDSAIAEREAADAARQDALSQRNAAEAARRDADSQRADAIASQRRAQALLQSVCVGNALGAARRGDIASALQELQVVEETGGGSMFAARLARALTDQSIRDPIAPPDGSMIATAIACSPDGRRVAVAYATTVWNAGQVRIVDVMSDSPAVELPSEPNTLVSELRFSPDGRFVVGAERLSKSMWIWDAASGRRTAGPIPISDLAHVAGFFAADGRTLSVLGADLKLRVVELATGAEAGPARELAGVLPATRHVAFSVDGTSYVLDGAGHRGLKVYDLATGNQRGKASSSSWSQVGLYLLGISPRGDRVVSVGVDGNARLSDPETGELVGSLLDMGARVVDVEFSGDGALVALCSSVGAVQLWDARTAEPAGPPMHGHVGPVNSLSFSPDGRTLFSAGNDCSVRAWSVAGTRQRAVVRAAETGRGDTMLALALRRTSAASSALTTIDPLRTLRSMVVDLAFTADSRELLALNALGGIVRSDALTGRRLGRSLDTGTPLLDVPADAEASRERMALASSGGMVRRMAVDPAGNRVVVTSPGGFMQMWDLARSAPAWDPVQVAEQLATAVAFSPDGRMVVAACVEGAGGSLVRVDAAAGTRIGEPLRAEGAPVIPLACAISPDSRTVAACLVVGSVHRWDLASGALVGTPIDLGGSMATCLSFGPDGRTLSIGCADASIRVVDLDSDGPVGTPLRGHSGPIAAVQFTPDGSALVSLGNDRDVRFWDPVTGRPLGAPTSIDGLNVSRMAVRPDGGGIALLAIGASQDLDSVAELIDTVPMRERFAADRMQLGLAQQAREILEPPDAAGAASLEELQSMVESDPRLRGAMRMPALVALGMIEEERAERTEQSKRSLAAHLMQDSWAGALEAVTSAPKAFLEELPVALVNEIAWMSLTTLAADDLSQRSADILALAEIAVERSGRKDASILDTLARAHWVRGDKPKAIEVQREAIAALGAGPGDSPPEESKRLQGELAATLAQYESLPAGAPLPVEGGAGASP